MAGLEQFPVEHRHLRLALVGAGGGSGGFGTALLQQQAAQRAQVIQDAAARPEVVRELLQIIEDQAQCLQLFGVGSAVEIGVHRLFGFQHSLVQELQVFLRALDAVEGGL